MKFFLFICSLTFFTTTYCQSATTFSIGTIKKLYSQELQEEREIWVYNPGGTRPSITERYPVMYLLDAEDHFLSTVGMIKQMTGRWPAMIVVGITNTNRSRDLTPTLAGSNGGGEQFMRFVEKELMPHIDSAYNTAPYRLFSGHSLGGLTVIHTLLNHPDFFNAYIAIDPSLWWNDEALVKQAPKDFNAKKFDNVSLFVGRARNMPPGMDTLTALQDKTQYTMLYRSVTKFIKELPAEGSRGLRWKTKFYPEESHGTVQLNGQYDALKFLFSYYQFRTSVFELNPQMNIDSALVAHFENISRHLGYTVHPSESLVNNLGYTCMSLHKMDKAEAFFKMNIDNFPGHANCYDSMGDFYAATGNTKKAIENYSKALTLGTDADTKRKLEALK